MSGERQLELVPVQSRRRRLLEQLDEHDPNLSLRDLVRYVERTLEVSPLQRGRRWQRPGELRFDDGSV